jgi:hypothetical protein
VPRFVVCVPAQGGPSIAPCGDVDAVAHIPMTIEMAAPGDISFANSNELFAYGFGIVLGFWAIGVAIGAILSLIRRGV